MADRFTRVSYTRNRTLALAALVAAIVAGAYLLWPSTARRERDAAVAFARSGSFAKAEDGLRRAVERDQDDVEVVELLARGYLSAKNLEKSEAFLTRWVALRPDDPEPVRLRMGAYRDHRALDRAFADGVRLLALEPRSREARWEVLQVAYSAGEFAAAEELCRAGLAAGEVRYRVPLAEVRRARGDAAGAAEVLDDALRESPTDTAAMIVRATLYDEAGQPAKAAPLLREVIRLDRKQALPIGYQLGMILEKAGELDEARVVQGLIRAMQEEANAEEAAAARPNDPAIRVRLGAELLAAGHQAAGVRFLKAALRIDPDYRPAHAALADYYDRHAQPAAAAEHRRRASDPR